MNVLILSMGMDVAGNGIALARALRKTGVDARAVCRRVSRFGYPTDIVWGKTDGVTGRMVARLFTAADVVHVMETPSLVRWFRDWRGKTIVVQQLGSRFRKDPAAMLQACDLIRATVVAGVPDRHYVSPSLPWLSGAFDLEALAALRVQLYQPSDRIRIAHAPTKRTLKSTDALIAAVERLSTRYPVDLDIIEGVPNDECLERKATADILFDQTLYGFGANAIEAWGMGIPVVAGCADPVHREAMHTDYGDPAYVEATEDTIEQALEQLMDPAERERWGEHGRWFAERNFADRVVAEQALGIYRKAALRVAA